MLETGDPLIGHAFPLGGNSYDTGIGGDGNWHPQEQVYLSWFARETPSRALFGQYTYANTLTSFAPGC